MAEIVLDHVVKRYPDGALAVDDFNLKINDGEFIILVGPSGCGKSTTLNMVAGLEDITQGDLLIDGDRVIRSADKQNGSGVSSGHCVVRAVDVVQLIRHRHGNGLADQATWCSANCNRDRYSVTCHAACQ